MIVVYVVAVWVLKYKFYPVLALMGAPLILALLLGRTHCGWLCFQGGMYEIIATPLSRRKKVPRIMDNLAFRILAGLTIFFGAHFIADIFGVPGAISDPVRTGIQLGIIGLGLSVGILFQPRAYCLYLCPMGSILSLVSKLSRRGLRVTEACNRCLACEKVCQKPAILCQQIEEPHRVG
jgi:polyferredoxin